MQALEVAIDDYLHTIVRSQPWIKKQEETALLAFCEWLYDQQISGTLADVGPELTARYAGAAEVSAADHATLNHALQHVFAWAEYQHEVAGNPFRTAST